jgi:translation elongation factor EF-1beta
MLFVKYLDNNADLLVKAGKKVADDAYNILADAARRDAEDREDMESDREYQRQHGYDGQRDITQASDVNEAKLKEMLKKAIMKRLLKEQTTFETRLFQVNLKIQVDPSVGGGIEQKLNRIRAIEGVTVVGHDDLSAGGQRQVIEARVKFHPDSDALRPMTYVSQTLVPEINSSKLVPGVKVIDIVKGSLKRLDK